jgi:hypothetical protein
MANRWSRVTGCEPLTSEARPRGLGGAVTTTRRTCLAAAAALALAAGAAAQDGPPRPLGPFIEVVPTEGRAAVRLAAAQVVRVARVETHTVIDTTAWVQQRTIEPIDSVARRLAAAGQRLVALTDLSNGRIWLAADRIVLVRGSEERHAAGARAAIVMVGLRFNTDIAVRESVEEVMAALRRAAEGNGPPEAPAAGAAR